MISYKDELCHHGVKGQRWGVRRYQDPTGKLTTAGEKRYNAKTVSSKNYTKEDKKWIKQVRKDEIKRIHTEHRKELRSEYRKARVTSRSKHKTHWEIVHRKMGKIYTQYDNVFVKDLKSPSGKSIKFVENRLNYKKPKLVLTNP